MIEEKFTILPLKGTAGLSIATSHICFLSNSPCGTMSTFPEGYLYIFNFL